MASAPSQEHARLFVVRHADAGVRGHGHGDHLRPLSNDGRARARRLVDLLDLTSTGRVVSSPYVRCVQTVEALATRYHKPVVLDDALAEGAAIEETLGLLRRLPDGSVACTHGDILERLVSEMDTLRWPVDEISFDKGGVWVLWRHGEMLSIVKQMRMSLDLSMIEL